MAILCQLSQTWKFFNFVLCDTFDLRTCEDGSIIVMVFMTNMVSPECIAAKEGRHWYQGDQSVDQLGRHHCQLCLEC